MLKWFRRTAILIPLAGLPACVSTPSPGDRLVMEVTRLPTTWPELQWKPGLALAIQRGVTAEDVRASRLVTANCYFEPGQHGRHGFVLLPPGVKVAAGDILLVEAEQADGREGPYGYFFGRFIGRDSARDSDYFERQFSFKPKVPVREYRCGPVSADGTLRVAAHSSIHYWDYDFAYAESLRNREINAEELGQGRIVMGECTTGADSWATWKVRLPAGMSVKVGDYIEAVAGSYELSNSTGPISSALRKVAKPGQDGFARTLGQYRVRCSATARPLAPE